tara:strand:- start:933 stop:1334 length:402 start_codon:yes stop_codon:yes gene_type:complete
MDQELIMKLTMLEGQARELQEKSDLVDKQLSELTLFNSNLDDLADSEEKSMLATLGKGVYIKTELKDQDLFVDIGAGVLVKKSPKETKETIKNQIKGLNDLKLQLTMSIEDLNSQLQEGLRELEKQQAIAQSS